MLYTKNEKQEIRKQLLNLKNTAMNKVDSPTKETIKNEIIKIFDKLIKTQYCLNRLQDREKVKQLFDKPDMDKIDKAISNNTIVAMARKEEIKQMKGLNEEELDDLLKRANETYAIAQTQDCLSILNEQEARLFEKLGIKGLELNEGDTVE